MVGNLPFQSLQHLFDQGCFLFGDGIPKQRLQEIYLIQNPAILLLKQKGKAPLHGGFNHVDFPPKRLGIPSGHISCASMSPQSGVFLGLSYRIMETNAKNRWGFIFASIFLMSKIIFLYHMDNTDVKPTP